MNRWWSLYDKNDKLLEKGHVDPKQFWNYYNLPNDLTGKIFYDIGAWDGGLCVEAARKNAKEVYGIDSFVWEFNDKNYVNFCKAKEIYPDIIKEAWVVTENIQEKEGWRNTPVNLTNYKEHQNKSNVRQFIDVYGLADIVLAAGIIYHLRDPIKFILDLKDIITKNGTLYITTWCLNDTQPIMKIVPNWRNDPSNYWLLSRSCMQYILEMAGFKVDKMVDAQKNPTESLVCFICSKK